ncbi:efflux RND transporter periplasmic adaptor subunit [Photobacterium sp. SDRW27]|uniref:efflux RND transporter periplasmic adaptor subunit n=1 Tax=Photobacterium obscurum TaxID=2829490 RepID=UPI00224331F0|nr:efflux RND transporter periplasmic adaptor subunit [Photobacterium obscurum]MCW8329151.1 efflux RND transporter periplasmic adaptor subunit [Photobacterium obscurum]
MKSASLSILALFISSTVLTGCGFAESAAPQQAKVRPVKLMTIEDVSGHQTRIFPAKVAANQQADLAFRINGELVKLDLIEGQKVKKGQLLAQLDDRDAKNALMDAEANYELAAVDFKRKEEIYKRKLISKAEYDTAKATLKSAKAALATARDQLDYTRLTAPFSGIVAKVERDNHQMIQATQVVLSLQGAQLLDVEIQVPESFLMTLNNKKLDEEYQPLVRFGSHGALYPVTYKEHASKVSPGTQTYEVVFSLNRPESLNVLPGMSAELLLDMSVLNQETAPMIAVLPQTAIFKSDEEQQTKVWRYDADTQKLESVEVTLGQVRAQGIEVLSGINKGDQIVAVGASVLKQDMDVKPLRWERGV